MWGRVGRGGRGRGLGIGQLGERQSGKEEGSDACKGVARALGAAYSEVRATAGCRLSGNMVFLILLFF